MNNSNIKRVPSYTSGGTNEKKMNNGIIKNISGMARIMVGVVVFIIILVMCVVFFVFTPHNGLVYDKDKLFPELKSWIDENKKIIEEDYNFIKDSGSWKLHPYGYQYYPLIGYKENNENYVYEDLIKGYNILLMSINKYKEDTVPEITYSLLGNATIRIHIPIDISIKSYLWIKDKIYYYRKFKPIAFDHTNEFSIHTGKKYKSIVILEILVERPLNVNKGRSKAEKIKELSDILNINM